MSDPFRFDPVDRPAHREGRSPPRPSAITGVTGEAGASAVGEEAPAAGSCTILVAEDDKAMRESVVEILALDRHVIYEVGDGASALDLLQHTLVDVLVLDLRMPKLGGLDLLRLIDGPRPAVIIHSAFEDFDKALVQQEFGLKVFKTLRKPVGPRTLVSAVEEACPDRPGSDTDPCAEGSRKWPLLALNAMREMLTE